MRNYLSLIPISARRHKRQNRMTILCIVISVLLVTAIFGTTDIMLRAKGNEWREKHGTWHLQIKNLAPDVAEALSESPDVIALGWSERLNENADLPYTIGEKKASLHGVDDVYITQLVSANIEGSSPQSDNEVMLSGNAKLALDVNIGDIVTIGAPAGNREYVVSGFGSDDQSYYRDQTFLVGVYMTQSAFTSLLEQNHVERNPSCYIQFESAAKAAKAIEALKERYNVENISENTAIMTLEGQSSNESVKNLYGMAGILFVLVLMAGALMISGSMNSNVSQRTKFFGMMRCIGASRRQIIRFVRLEALNWCKTAVPVGLLFGTGVCWSICALLRYGVGGEFSTVQVISFSPIGVISGAVLGVMTVLIAAQSPAKRAARVSPMAAVSGNADNTPKIRHSLRQNLRRVEKTLGTHHATASRKNWFLMTASFSLSIILFLCFSVGLQFARELVPSIRRSWEPDITLNGYANEQVLRQDLYDSIHDMSGVEYLFGSAYMENIPAVCSQSDIDHINLTSYSDSLLDRTEESLIEGDISKIRGDSDQVMTVRNKDNPLQVGDTIQIANNTVTISCALSDGLFPSAYGVICSQETFTRLTGQANYSIMGIQLKKDAAPDTIRQINNLIESNVIFADNRSSNQENKKTYWAVGFVMYSFLTILAMITLFYIVNSISMSVTARMKQYGAMRAVGMSVKQLTRMIAAEAFTYAFSGLVVGCGVGIALHRLLYTKLLTHYMGIAWSFPAALLIIVIAFDMISVAVAVHEPTKRIRKMVITETINQL